MKTKLQPTFCFCIFTYGEDAYMLWQCIRAIRKIGGTRNNIFVFDDAANPLPYPPPNVKYKQTYFDRKGNLNGKECTQGMLFSMLEAAKESKADVVIKVDSDTILNNLTWLLNNDFMNSHCGFKLKEDQHHISGQVYSLPSWCLFKMLQEIYKLPQSDLRGESILISHLSKRVGLEHVGYECNSKNHELWRCASISSSEIQENGTVKPHGLLLMSCLDVVLCDLIETDKRDKKKNALLMKAFLDHSEQ